jgi:hypothetical protein
LPAGKRRKERGAQRKKGPEPHPGDEVFRGPVPLRGLKVRREKTRRFSSSLPLERNVLNSMGRVKWKKGKGLYFNFEKSNLSLDNSFSQGETSFLD